MGATSVERVPLFTPVPYLLAPIIYLLDTYILFYFILFIISFIFKEKNLAFFQPFTWFSVSSFSIFFLFLSLLCFSFFFHFSFHFQIRIALSREMQYS